MYKLYTIYALIQKLQKHTDKRTDAVNVPDWIMVSELNMINKDLETMLSELTR